MTPDVALKLRDLNQQFYSALADSFAESRATPQPGFARLKEWIPAKAATLLDVGCGNGRFAHFLLSHQAIKRATGVDFSTDLLKRARLLVPQATFFQRDMTQPGFLEGLGDFDLIACLAAMQHVPGRENRATLLQELKTHLAPGGRLFLANWQFMDSPRQRRKIREWSELGLTTEDVEANDYLLTWQRSGFGLRYVCQVDAVETAVLAEKAGLHILHQFRSDGKEGNLSLYTIFTHAS